MNKKKQGRGRPKGAETVVKRIHKAIEPAVDNLSLKYKEQLKGAIDKFSSLDVPKSKRNAYKILSKPLKALVKDLID